MATTANTMASTGKTTLTPTNRFATPLTRPQIGAKSITHHGPRAPTPPSRSLIATHRIAALPPYRPDGHLTHMVNTLEYDHLWVENVACQRTLQSMAASRSPASVRRRWTFKSTPV